jgi:S-adenosylmethionine:tRNA ribosyltransferase-isomerase
MILTSKFDYPLPEQLIAHEPVIPRDSSRLMVLDRKSGEIKDLIFHQITDYLYPGDLLILNNTKVIPANLVGRKAEGTAKIEVLLAQRLSKNVNTQVWECLVKPGKRLKVGSQIIFSERFIGKVLEKKDTGEQVIEFQFEGNFGKLVSELGKTPLPPYVKPRKDLSRQYQTVFADKPGASAAPTAGFHFTNELLRKLEEKGVKISYLTLHTGIATFRPVYTENIQDHKMHKETFFVPKETVVEICKAKRVIAVGTTTVRTLETIAKGKIDPRYSIYGKTDLFIYPGYRFKLVDSLITNFHFPRSTLLMLVSAFAGEEKIKKAYQEAIFQGYRFFSFGDAMFIV